MILLIIANLVSFFSNAYSHVKQFTYSGHSAIKLLETIKDNASSDSKLLVVVDPVACYEISYSITVYLELHNIKQLCWYPIMRIYKTDFEKILKEKWLKRFKGKELHNIKGLPDVIIVFNRTWKTAFFHESGLNTDDYREVSPPGSESLVFVRNKTSLP